ncbi:MAG: tripartite tricarboxylate transporter permease, partial [Geminicoccaceae bacterium]
MLSVFHVHNVIPGPNLFQNQLDFVYALYIAMLILNVIVVAFLLVSTNVLTKVIQVPTRFLGMVILTLSFVGVYSLRNSIIDCAIASAFGILGLILKRLNLPIVPIVLGMVLGGIMEVKLRSSLARVNTPLDFVDRPIAAFLALMIVLVIIMHVRTLRREHKARLAEADTDHAMHDSQIR